MFYTTNVVTYGEGSLEIIFIISFMWLIGATPFPKSYHIVTTRLGQFKIFADHTKKTMDKLYFLGFTGPFTNQSKGH